MAAFIWVASIVVLLVCPAAIYCSNVTVNSSTVCCGTVNGTSIDDALGNINSGDYLRLLSGCHCVRAFNVVKNVTDVSLIGDGDVQVTCAPGLGLAFLNVTRLSIQGLTITGCGLNGPNAVWLNTAINSIADLFLELAEDINIAVVLGSCTDVVMDNVTITNTTGIGLVGVNVAGQSNFTNNAFIANAGQHCFGLATNSSQPRNYTVGGGASFIYADYVNQDSNRPVNLNIDNSTFSRNSYCGMGTYVQIFYQYYPAFRNDNYTVGAGGGLSFSLAQQRYSLNIHVQRSSFSNNTATLGSAASVHWYAGLQDTHVVFSDCNFYQNGFAPNQQTTQGALGYAVQGGVLFLKDLVLPSRPWPGIVNSSNTMVFTRSRFASNSGFVGSGILISSQYLVIPSYVDTVLLDNCLFENNVATVGTALYISESKFHGRQVGLIVTIQNCKFSNNTVDQSTASAANGVFAVVEASLMNVTIRDSSFLSNIGTAVGGSASLINLEGSVHFYNNTALMGGALSLVSAAVAIIKQNTVVTFSNNTATISGGAVYGNYLYAGQLNFGSLYDCILQFQSEYIFCNAQYQCPDITRANITIGFYNNRAKLGGSLYGSTLDTCPWAIALKQQLNQNGSILDIMYQKNITFHFDPNPSAPSVISTPVSSLVIDVNSTPAYMPGQRFNLNVFSADRLNQEVPTTVAALPTSAKVGDAGYWLTSVPNVGTKISGQQNVTINLLVYSVDNYVQSNSISVSITPCQFGFYYTTGDCLCQAAITDRSDVKCDGDLKVFYISYGKWFGPVSNETGLVIQDCLSDYCLPPDNNNLVITVNPKEIDQQCAYNRTGLLCGKCQEGYSAVFGTNRCMKCSNDTLALLMFFAAAGICIIALITFFHISISEGYINGILFYVSVVSTYETYFTRHFLARGVFIPIYLINLDMGFETCFYDGMTPLARAGLGLVFPTYLFVLMILFIWVTSRSLRLSEWLAKSNYTPSKLVATLIVLSYNSITQSCIQILGFMYVQVHEFNGTSYYITSWATDPNVEYFSSVHAVLFVIAVCLVVVFVIPVPIFLILPSLTSRAVVGRLKPLYDAFVCYYKDRYAFWLGMRLVLRAIIFVLASFLQPPLNILLLGVCIALIIFASSIVHPFKLASQGALDSFFLSNVVLLVTGSLYFQMLEASSLNADKSEMVFVLVVVGVAYVVMFGIIVWHLLLRFPKLMVFHCCRKSHTEVQLQEGGYGAMGGNVQYSSDVENELDASTEEPRLKVPKFSDYREPLLEDGSLYVRRGTNS